MLIWPPLQCHRVAAPLTTDILERIDSFYGIEAEVRARPHDVRLAAGGWRLAAQQNRTKQLVDALHEILDPALRRLSPKSDMEGDRLRHEAKAGILSRYR